jgi:two-component system, chemotaxis family, chemotaxis protein CheY
MKCLVVDDSATMRRIVINALKTIGYQNAIEAADGREALVRWDASIEMVITDWNMPNMGGLELVQHLRSDPKTARIPILMVTTRSLKEDIVQALDAGIDNYVLKPLTPQVLKERLDQVASSASGSA